MSEAKIFCVWFNWTVNHITLRYPARKKAKISRKLEVYLCITGMRSWHLLLKWFHKARLSSVALLNTICASPIYWYNNYLNNWASHAHPGIPNGLAEAQFTWAASYLNRGQLWPGYRPQVQIWQADGHKVSKPPWDEGSKFKRHPNTILTPKSTSFCDITSRRVRIQRSHMTPIVHKTSDMSTYNRDISTNFKARVRWELLNLTPNHRSSSLVVSGS